MYWEKLLKSIVYVILLALSASAFAGQAKPVVLSSIAPLQMLVSEIGGGEIRSELLIPSTASAHDFSLRPSDIKRVRGADLVLWIGPAMEGNVAKILRRHPRSVAMFPALGHNDDPHVWLDAKEIQPMALAIAAHLAELMPEKSDHFLANAARFNTSFRLLDSTVAKEIQSAKKGEYLLLHDGFSRFERHYGLPVARFVVTDSSKLPGTRHLAELRSQLQAGAFSCVFSEPQYPLAILDALLAGVEVPLIELDVMATSIAQSDGFLALYRQVAMAFLSCFKR